MIKNKTISALHRQSGGQGRHRRPQPAKRGRARMTAKRTLDAMQSKSYLRGLLGAFPSGPATGEGGKSRGAEPLWVSPPGRAARFTALLFYAASYSPYLPLPYPSYVQGFASRAVDKPGSKQCCPRPSDWQPSRWSSCLTEDRAVLSWD